MGPMESFSVRVIMCWVGILFGSVEALNRESLKRASVRPIQRFNASTITRQDQRRGVSANLRLLVRAVSAVAAAHRMSVLAVPVQRLVGPGLEKLRDERRRHITQAVLALRAGEMIAVAAGSEFIGYLIDDERGMGRRREELVSPMEDLPLLRLVENAERD